MTMNGNSAKTPPGRGRQLIEVLVFLFLFMPSIALSFFIHKPEDLGFVVIAVATILRDLSLVFLILYFLWSNRESFHSIGLSMRKFWIEAGIGILLFIPVTVSANILERTLGGLGLSIPTLQRSQYLPPLDFAGLITGVSLILVVAIAEETVFRGYLMLRFRNLASTQLAVVLSSLIFAVGHGYEGTGGIVTVFYLGFVFALTYLWRGTLVAPMVMHFLQDFAAMIIIPLLYQG